VYVARIEPGAQDEKRRGLLMMVPMIAIPSGKDTDAEDVAWGLQTADALWKSGARTDAIVWLRRAAQAAGEAADDGRALEFARSAADLSDWMANQPAPVARISRRQTHAQPTSPGNVRTLALWQSHREATALDRFRCAKLDDPRLVLLSDPDSPRAASFRLLRENILAKQRPRIIAVSSAGAGEGKTTCAINLALSMCERPLSKVLLLEGNFFEPSLDEIFHIDESTPPAPSMDLPWLAPYRVVEVVRGLHVAAIGRRRGAPGPGFNARWFEMVIDSLSAEPYDHLIIDAPVLDGSPAATQIVRAADGTLFAVRSGGTTAKTLRRAAEQVPRARMLGIALMDGAL
jgi:Mrp family chromosome partitioning ATPase